MFLHFLPGSLYFFPPTSLKPWKLASSLQLGPLRSSLESSHSAPHETQLTPPRPRSGEKHETLSRDFDFVRWSTSVVESLEASLAARPSAIIVHRSWYTFSGCREGAIRGERLCARSKDSLVVLSSPLRLSCAIERGERSTIDRARDWPPSAFLADAVSIFLDCLFFFFFSFHSSPNFDILFLSTQGNVQGATTVQVASFVFRVWEGSNGVL